MRENRADPSGSFDGHVDPLDLPPKFVRHGFRDGVYRNSLALEQLRRQVDARWPGRELGSDGDIGDAEHQARKSDHNPWVLDGEMGVVTAFDFTHDPAGGFDGEALSAAIARSQDVRLK